jgi:hypothetical protein
LCVIWQLVILKADGEVSNQCLVQWWFRKLIIQKYELTFIWTKTQALTVRQLSSKSVIPEIKAKGIMIRITQWITCFNLCVCIV